MAEPLVRIFVSSPSDLEHERGLVKDIIESLGQEYRPYFQVQAILWEQEALTAAQSFQAGLVRPSECEIVLVMLWTRLGTPLARDPYGGLTGTEWEFVDAVEASALTGRPEVLVYRKDAPRLVDVNNAEATREALADRQRVEGFFRDHFLNPDGSFRRAFRQFGTDRAFRDLVETQLRKLLNQRISAERRLSSAQADWHGSPFRAARPYEFADNAIFTGREAETRELISRLEALAARGKGLLLLTGASGVGKSSLIQAGLLPRLARPFLFPGVSLCRWCFVELGEEDPLGSLAQALAAPTLFGPVLQGFGLDGERLARLLDHEPQVAADQLTAALAQASAELAQVTTGGGGRVQLALVIDPLDPLFIPPRHPPERRQSFAAALRHLASREGIWIILSLRSDYLPDLAGLADLGAVLDPREGWLPLQPPAPVRIRQAIEIPARIAHLEYEEAGGQVSRGLVDALEAEASHLAHWPPLLQQALEALYARAQARLDEPEATERVVLTLDDLRRLGGLPGILLARANTLWAELAPPLRAALPSLCRALIALEGEGTRSLGSRDGDLRTLSRMPLVAELIERMIAARLLVADAERDQAGPPTKLPAAPRLRDDLVRLWRLTWRIRLIPKRLQPVSDELSLETQQQTQQQTQRGGQQETQAKGQGSGQPAPGVAATDAAPLPRPLPREGGGEKEVTATEAPPRQRSPEGEGEGEDGPPSWEDYRPILSFVHPALIERWQPVQDWLADPGHRRELLLRYQLSRQARLWRRTDCNREYLLGESGYAAALGFAEAQAEELEPLEREFLEQSRQELALRRRRNRLARSLGLTLTGLLILATVTAFWAWDASNQASLNYHRSELKTAEVAIDRGNTPEAVRLALDAGHELPREASDTLARALVKNQLLALVKTEVPEAGRHLGFAFSDDGERLVTQSPSGGAELWTLSDQRYRFDQVLFDADLPVHAVRMVGLGEQALLLGIGEAGVWRLPAEPGQAPDWTCGARPQSPSAVDGAGHYLALLHGEQRARSLCVLDLQAPGGPLWDRAIHERTVRSLAFAPDGRSLVTASFDGTAKVLATLDGKEILSVPTSGPFGRPAYHATFAPDGRRISVAWGDDRIRIYDLAGQEQAELGAIRRDGHEIRIHRSSVRKTAFGPNGKALVVVDDDGQVVRWDLGTGEAHIFGHHELAVEQLEISSGRNPGFEEPIVLTASLDNTVRLWGLWTGQGLSIVSHEGDVTEARFSRDERRILSWSQEDGSARLWSARPAETYTYLFPNADQVSHLAMAQVPASRPEPSAGGAAATLLATGAQDGRVEVWRYPGAAPGTPPRRLWRFGGEGRGHLDRVRRVAFAPDPRYLVSAGYDGTARVWDLTSGQECILPMTADGQPCVRTATADCPIVQQALLAPQEGSIGSWLLTASTDLRQPLRLWEPRACTPWGQDLPGDQGKSPLRTAALARDEDDRVWVATGNEAGEIRVLQVDPSGVWRALCGGTWHRGVVTDLAFAPGGGLLATASEDGRAALISLADEACGEPRYLAPRGGSLASVRFAPDGEALVTASQDGQAQLWRPDGTLFARLRGHTGRVATAEFSPDGRWLLTAGRDGSVRVWPRPTASRPEQVLEPFLTLAAGLGAVSQASFSPDGRNIGAGYRNDAALLWRLWSPQQTRNPRIESIWGPDRARLTLIQEAQRFIDEKLGSTKRTAP